MGWFKVWCMMQQGILRKYDYAHYCTCINKYLCSIAVCLHDISFYICMDDKNKISIGEPRYPFSALSRGKYTLVAKN